MINQVSESLTEIEKLWSRIVAASPRARDCVNSEFGETIQNVMLELQRNVRQATTIVEIIDSGGPRGTSGTGKRISVWG